MVIWDFRLFIFVSVPILSTSLVRHFVTKNVIVDNISSDELSAALLFLDDDEVELEIVLAFDFTALTLFLAKYKADNVALRLEVLVLHLVTNRTDESSNFLHA